MNGPINATAPKQSWSRSINDGVHIHRRDVTQNNADVLENVHESPGQNHEGKKKGASNNLLSHLASQAVPSALAGLTSEFGMGSGMALPVWSPAPYFELEGLAPNQRSKQEN